MAHMNLVMIRYKTDQETSRTRWILERVLYVFFQARPHIKRVQSSLSRRGMQNLLYRAYMWAGTVGIVKGLENNIIAEDPTTVLLPFPYKSYDYRYT